MSAEGRMRAAEVLGIRIEELKLLAQLLNGHAATNDREQQALRSDFGLSSLELKALRTVVSGAPASRPGLDQLARKVLDGQGAPSPSTTASQSLATVPMKRAKVSERASANRLIVAPWWVTEDTPRFFREWSNTSIVFVTDWGDRVHLYASCPGTKGFGADSTVIRARLSDRICFARSGCLKCFGEFWGRTSLAELEALIVGLHGRLDSSPGRRTTRSIVAEKITRRKGKLEVPPPTSARIHPQKTLVHSKTARERARQSQEAARLGLPVSEPRAQR